MGLANDIHADKVYDFHTAWEITPSLVNMNVPIDMRVKPIYNVLNDFKNPGSAINNHAILNKLRRTKEVYGIFNANDSKLRNLCDIHFQINEFYKTTDLKKIRFYFNTKAKAGSVNILLDIGSADDYITETRAISVYPNSRHIETFNLSEDSNIIQIWLYKTKLRDIDFDVHCILEYEISDFKFI